MFLFLFGKKLKRKSNYIVSWTFDFRKTNSQGITQAQLNKYMSQKKRYYSFAKDVFLYSEYSSVPKKITFNNGILTLELDPNKPDVYEPDKLAFPTKESVVKYLKNYNFADGLWESMPGSPGVYPDSNGNELGVIGIKKINVKK